MLFDDAKDRRQPQARAFAGFFGGKKRLENPRQDFRRYAAARVADAETDIAARHGIRIQTRELVVHGFFRRLNDQPSALGHGVAGIHGQIHQHLFQHARHRRG